METSEIFPVNLLPVGPFGQAVLRYFRELEPKTINTEVLPNSLPAVEQCCRARVNVIVAWRPVAELCDYLDLISRENKRCFFPLVMEGSVLRLGPVVVPGAGGCWPCWTKRTAQHAASPDDYSTVMSYYSLHPLAGPKGYLEPYAMLAAVKIKQTLDSRPAMQAGYMWQLDTITRQMLTSTMIGVHNCPRCGLERNESTRSISELQDQVSFLWRSDVQGLRTP